MPNIKRHGVEYIDGGGAASLSPAEDMQHYSDLLSTSAQNIQTLMVIADVSDIPKLTNALNVAYQNIRWISADMEKYVRATFESEGIRIAPIPINKFATSIVSLNKLMATFATQFASQAITIASIRRQVKALAKPIADMLEELSNEYDMYAGMAHTISDRGQIGQNDLKDISSAVDKTVYALDKYSSKSGDPRSTVTNRSAWDQDPKNIGPINNIVFDLEGKLKTYTDPESKRYVNTPAIASAMQGYLVACKRLHGVDAKKFWDVLNPVAVALERLKDVL